MLLFRRLCFPWLLGLLCACAEVTPLSQPLDADEDRAASEIRPSLRVATFNVSMFSDRPDGLKASLEANDARMHQVAAVIQRVRPEVLLLNEFDYSADPAAREMFIDWLRQPQTGGDDGIDYPYHYTAEVNTGVPSGLDLDADGRTDGPADAWGFGKYPGQYGMLVLSRYPIDKTAVRSFRNFRWAQMPGALRPQLPDGEPFYSDAVWSQLPLSSKSHWDIPIDTPKGRLHLLAMHPTPPVFDGPEDRNGRRNHDEIRLFADYLNPQTSAYLVDDAGRVGGIEPDASFVIVGDQNADPMDGDAYPGAIAQLLEHPAINSGFIPASRGAAAQALSDGPPNDRHRGESTNDTANFGEPYSGNMRIDYVLPSRNLQIVDGGVFWPAPGEPGAELAGVSDHHMVWLDLR